MRRTSIALALLACMVVAAPANAAIGRVKPNARFRGHDLIEWQRIYERWRLGVNGLYDGGCGDIVDGVLFVEPLIFGQATLACDIPAGTRILIEAGAAFSEIPTYADTRAAARADARARWASIVSTAVSIDSTVIRSEDVYREAGVYQIRFVQGSWLSYDCVFLVPPCVSDNTPPGPAMVASVGRFVMVRPLPPGDHNLSVSTEYTDYVLSLSAAIHVG
jgi:hypothetical protein